MKRTESIANIEKQFKNLTENQKIYMNRFMSSMFGTSTIDAMSDSQLQYINSFVESMFCNI